MAQSVGTRTIDSIAIERSARELLPTIAARADEIEAARRIPPDLVDLLVGAGAFRILLPESHGGAGADLPAALRLHETLSSADASVGWTVMIGSAGWCDLTGLDRPVFDALFADDPDALLGGVFSPSGVARREAGGHRVAGRWGFASGCEHCTWLYANCVEELDGDHRLRTVVFRRDEVTIEDTWDVMGLRGTGSHHIRADDVLVPEERTFATLESEPCVDSPAARIPPAPLFALHVASVALGIARGAIDDILALCAAKVPLLERSPLAANPAFQYDLATMDTDLRAARSLFYETAGDVWSTAAAGAPLTIEERARIRAAAAWVVERAATIVATAYRAGGGSSLYRTSPLQRRFRDVHAVTQHFLVKRDTMTTAGAVLAGQEIAVPVF